MSPKLFGKYGSAKALGAARGMQALRGTGRGIRGVGRLGWRATSGVAGAVLQSSGFAPVVGAAASLGRGLFSSKRGGRSRGGGGSSASETGLLNTSLLFQIRDEVAQIKGLLVTQQVPESERREREFESWRRHRELLSAISGLSGVGGGGPGPGGKSGGGLGDLLKGLLAITGLAMLPKLLENIPSIIDGIQSFLDKMALFLLGMWGTFKLLGKRTKAMKPPALKTPKGISKASHMQKQRVKAAAKAAEKARLKTQRAAANKIKAAEKAARIKAAQEAKLTRQQRAKWAADRKAAMNAKVVEAKRIADAKRAQRAAVKKSTTGYKSPGAGGSTAAAAKAESLARRAATVKKGTAGYTRPDARQALLAEERARSAARETNKFKRQQQNIRQNKLLAERLKAAGTGKFVTTGNKYGTYAQSAARTATMQGARDFKPYGGQGRMGAAGTAAAREQARIRRATAETVRRGSIPGRAHAMDAGMGRRIIGGPQWAGPEIERPGPKAKVFGAPTKPTGVLPKATILPLTHVQAQFMDAYKTPTWNKTMRGTPFAGEQRVAPSNKGLQPGQKVTFKAGSPQGVYTGEVVKTGAGLQGRHTVIKLDPGQIQPKGTGHASAGGIKGYYSTPTNRVHLFNPDALVRARPSQAATAFAGETRMSPRPSTVKAPVVPNPWFDVPERGMKTNKNMFSKVWKNIKSVLKTPSRTMSPMSKYNQPAMVNKGPGMMKGRWGAMGMPMPKLPTAAGRLGRMMKNFGKVLRDGLMKGLEAASGFAKVKWIRRLGAIGTFIFLVCAYAEVVYKYMSGGYGTGLNAFLEFSWDAAKITVELALIIGVFLGITALLGLAVAAMLPALAGGVVTGVAIAGIAGVITYFLEGMFRSGEMPDPNVDPMDIWRSRKKNLINKAAKSIASDSPLGLTSAMPSILGALAIDAGIGAYGALFGKGSPMQKNEAKRKREVAINMQRAYNFAGSDFFKKRGGHSDPQPLGDKIDTKKLGAIVPTKDTPEQKVLGNRGLKGSLRKLRRTYKSWQTTAKDPTQRDFAHSNMEMIQAQIWALLSMGSAEDQIFVVYNSQYVDNSKNSQSLSSVTSVNTNAGSNVSVAGQGFYE